MLLQNLIPWQLFGPSAISHFYAYLHGYDVTIYTDHSSVKKVLKTPSPSTKHTRWWSKESGVKSVHRLCTTLAVPWLNKAENRIFRSSAIKLLKFQA